MKACGLGHHTEPYSRHHHSLTDTTQFPSCSCTKARRHARRSSSTRWRNGGSMATRSTATQRGGGTQGRMPAHVHHGGWARNVDDEGGSQGGLCDARMADCAMTAARMSARTVKVAARTMATALSVHTAHTVEATARSTAHTAAAAAHTAHTTVAAGRLMAAACPVRATAHMVEAAPRLTAACSAEVAARTR